MKEAWNRFIDFIDFKDLTSGVITGILVLMIPKIFRFFYYQINRMARRRRIFEILITFTTNVLLNEKARLIYFFLLIFSASFLSPYISIVYRIPLFVLILIIFFSFYKKTIFLLPSFNKKADTFESFDHQKWKVIQGSPSIVENQGNPPPCLKLQFINSKINSFVVLQRKSFTDVIIESDVLLTKNSLVNFIIGNPEEGHYWMARFDGRPTYFNSILYSPKSHNWGNPQKENGRAPINEWFRAKVQFSKGLIKMWLNEKEILEYRNDAWEINGMIGFFNEVGDVFIDNFNFKKL